MTGKLTRRNEIVVISENKETPYYGWFTDGSDVFLNMGGVQRAVVIRFWSGESRETANGNITNTGYYVSWASFFPFPDRIYDARFETKKEVMDIASEYLKTWFEESIEKLGL